MNTDIKLTNMQRQVLEHAAKQTAGQLDWFPDNLKGGARKKVIDGLANRALITSDGTDWVVAAGGYDALGLPRPTPAVRAALKPRTREHSKQAQVIVMLKRPEGATIAQICEATGWQTHTVRGTFAGAFKKKLGLTVTSEKAAGQERVYRITD